jgi:sugar lactone lactonase YvrE
MTISVSRTRWAALGAAAVVALGGGSIALVTAGSSTASSFVPITPCRLLDTRSTSPVGPRSTPITAGESLQVQVTGSNGSCVIPTSATAMVINVTAVGPTASSFITLFPADVALPNASNLNFIAGQAPTPNLVTVSLSAAGAIKIFNESGAVNVIGDVAGYYQPDNGTANAGTACTVNGLAGVIVNGYDQEHNVSSKCFTSLVTTLAGSGTASSVDGVGNLATFNGSAGVAVDTVGNIYVADVVGNKIRKVSVTGVVTTLASGFNAPQGVAVDSVGNVYVADANNNLIRKVTPAGVVTTFAGDGSLGAVDGTGLAASFRIPTALAVDAAGNVYVADTGNNRIRKITPAAVVSTLAGSSEGFADGTGAAAQFDEPSGIAVDGAGNVYVGDFVNNRIRKVTAAGVVTTFAGQATGGFADGVGGAAKFTGPAGVAVDAAGNVYVADFNNQRIRKITAAGAVSTLAGSGVLGFADGVGTAAQFNSPYGIAVDAAGTIYVGDQGNNRVRRIQ